MKEENKNIETNDTTENTTAEAVEQQNANAELQAETQQDVAEQASGEEVAENAETAESEQPAAEGEATNEVPVKKNWKQVLTSRVPNGIAWMVVGGLSLATFLTIVFLVLR